MKIYRGFPERLHHRVPHWVEPGAVFHIRVGLDHDKKQKPLIHVALAQPMLDSVQFYQVRTRWHITLFLLMPDHVHAVLSFARDESMSEVIRDWKRFHNRSNNVRWQEGYFDHRLRLDERGAQLSAKLNYIRQNPVAAGLCAKAEDWRGKGDAVRLGFELATKDILMILDADLTTSPEELPRFYHAIATNKAEFVNGSRLVYPMEKDAMRFFNILGNKFFAIAFSFMLGQRFKDTLCGTKVLWRTDYERLAAAREFFGDFDPFGDFDLLFGAARMGLRIVEIPVHYQERKYGTTNIQRWRHGWILLRMLLFAARRLKFLGHETLHVR